MVRNWWWREKRRQRRVKKKKKERYRHREKKINTEREEKGETKNWIQMSSLLGTTHNLYGDSLPRQTNHVVNLKAAQNL